MKSPSRDHYQSQAVYKIGLASYLYLRFLLSAFILLGLALHPTSGVLASGGKATLEIKGYAVCTMQGRTDYQKSEATILLQLPKEDGPIKGQGRWWVTTTGYGTINTKGGGKVVLRGQLRNGFLIFPEPDYYMNGILQVFPKKSIIRLKAETESKFVQPNQWGCKGNTIYRLYMRTTERLEDVLPPSKAEHGN
jgi:hypothetical protein